MASTSMFYSSLIILILLVHPAFRSCIARKLHLPTNKPQHDNKILQEPLMKVINSNDRAGWKAAMSPRFANYTVAEFKRILGSKPLPGGDPTLPVVTYTQALLDLPESFDARTAWPQCSTISGILDQGHCGSCWAFGAVEALSDRFCVHFGKNISLSVNDLLSCCGELCGDGCDGGSPAAAWRYLVNTGVVTQQCDSYFDTKGCTHPGCAPIYPTPTCSTKCAIQTMGWQSSKHFAANGYKVSSDPYSIMAEVYTNGPVQVSFTIYRDFVHYKSGVYKHIVGEALGGHAVKLIGWGTSDSGEDYWVLANQWNKSWGEDGFFRITRGTNECGIEDDVVAGLPADKHLSR